MTSADRQTVVRKLGYLQKNLQLLDAYQGLTLQEMERSPEKRFSLERLLQTAVETVIDCSRLLVALEEWRNLRDERDAVLILGEQGVLPADLAKRLTRAKGFRNVLVHEYVEINPTLILEHLKTGLPDSQAFTVAMATWIEKK